MTERDITQLPASETGAFGDPNYTTEPVSRWGDVRRQPTALEIVENTPVPVASAGDRLKAISTLHGLNYRQREEQRVVAPGATSQVR